MINCKIIHATPSESNKGGRPSENYNNRRKFLLDNTIPMLEGMNIQVSFFDAIMYPNLVFDRNLEHKSHNPKLKIQYQNTNFLIDNPFPTAYEIALGLGHYFLWKESADTNNPLLIMEDDVLILEQNKENIVSSILEFLSIQEPAILYLQSTDPCTLNPKVKLKQYSEHNLQRHSKLFKVNNNHSNWSGTAAYIVNSFGAKKLIQRANEIGLKCSDGFIHKAINEKYIDVYIPCNYKQAVLLHPEYS